MKSVFMALFAFAVGAQGQTKLVVAAISGPSHQNQIAFDISDGKHENIVTSDLSAAARFADELDVLITPDGSQANLEGDQLAVQKTIGDKPEKYLVKVVGNGDVRVIVITISKVRAKAFATSLRTALTKAYKSQ